MFSGAGEAPGQGLGPTGSSECWSLVNCRWHSGVRTITPDYFKTFGIRLLQGRTFNEQDGASGEKVALVNEEFVHTFLHGTNPLLHQISIKQSPSA